MTAMGKKTARHALAALLILIALALYGYGALTDRAFDPAERARQAFLARVADNPRDAAQTRALAEAYWTRNPDVAGDKIFGREGALGIFGPRDHYARHGKSEGRRWGK